MRYEHVLADREAAVLLEVPGHELGGARRDRRAKREAVPWLEMAEQVVEHGPDLAEVDLDVAEGGRAERDGAVPRARGVGPAVGDVQNADAIERLLHAALLEGHPAIADRARA